MTKAVTTRSPFPAAMEQPFEEVPLIWKEDKATKWFGGYVSGQVEISYYPNRDWWISDIFVAVDNGRRGDEAEGKLLAVNPEDNRDLYTMLHDSIMEHCGSRFEVWVDDELAYAKEAA